jgi:small GTP-binding protein
VADPMDQCQIVEFSVKTIVVGGSGVGKTSLLSRFTRDCFDEASQPAMGVEFLSRIMDTPNRHHIELQLWDTAGQEMFRAVTRGYYRGASVVYIVFDLSSRKSFEGLDKWIADVNDVVPDGVVMVLIGNKTDLPNREVSETDGKQFAAGRNLKYFETSAKTGHNVMTAIASVLADIDKLADQGKFHSHTPSDSIVYDPVRQTTQGCC